jgi:hypothetical protein
MKVYTYIFSNRIMVGMAVAIEDLLLLNYRSCLFFVFCFLLLLVHTL